MILFVTGTGTGVGKTWVSAALAHEALSQGKRVIYYKPIQTGWPDPPGEDALWVQSALNHQVPVYNRYCFIPPVAPAAADPTGIIDLAAIQSDVAHYADQCDLLLVEGAGGLAVPISPSVLMIDLIQALNIPVVLVAHSLLGTINHTLLSLEALENRNIPVDRLVFNFFPADLEQADISIQTLLETIGPYLPADLPLHRCLDRSSEPFPSEKPLLTPIRTVLPVK